MKVEIYGASDDLVKVEGDLTEWFGAYDCPVFLHFGDGTVVEAEYDPCPGYYWRINPVTLGEGSQSWFLHGTYDGEDGRKCNRVRLVGDLKWVVCWSSIDGPTKDEIVRLLEEFNWSDLTQDQLLRIVRMVEQFLMLPTSSHMVRETK